MICYRVLLPVMARFGGKPVSSGAGMFLDFSRMREPRPSGGDDEDDHLVPSDYYQEKLWVFSEASDQQLLLAGGLGVANLIGALWLRGQVTELARIFPYSRPLLSTVAGAILGYAILFLIIPLIRYTLYLHWNQRVRERNYHRQELSTEYQKLVNEEGSVLYKKRQVMDAYREKAWREGGSKTWN